jgi:hypothetical protein
MHRILFSRGKPATCLFDWRYRGQSGTIAAHTRSEARAELKRRLGLKVLPAGIVLAKRSSNSIQP